VLPSSPGPSRVLLCAVTRCAGVLAVLPQPPLGSVLREIRAEYSHASSMGYHHGVLRVPTRVRCAERAEGYAEYSHAYSGSVWMWVLGYVLLATQVRGAELAEGYLSDLCVSLCWWLHR
jgi:hypothetical protein